MTLALVAGVQISNAQELPENSEIMVSLVLANQYFMDKWPDPGANIVTDKTRPSNLWTRATYYEGLMALYFISEDSNYYNYAYDWAESHDWLPTYGSLTTRDGDHQCCGQTYIELYELNPEVKKIEAITTNIENMINSSEIDDWSWIDAIQMSMPVFAKLGAVYNDQKYYDRMYEMFHYTETQHGTSGLYNSADGLWYRDKDFDPPYTTPNGKSCYWSRGNGWVYVALARVMDVIPESETHYNNYLTNFKEMSAAIVAYQREDGFWNPSMVDPEDYGGKETSGTGFFVYGLAWGINKGILDKETYLPAVIKGWNGLQNDALHEDGFLGWVQSTGKQPSDGQPLSYDKVPNFEDYGLGSFLLAGAETYKLASTVTAATSTETATQSMYISGGSGQEKILHFSTTKESEVSLDLYDLSGRKVKALLYHHNYPSGNHRITLDLQGVINGVYIVKALIGEECYALKVKR